MKTPTIKLVLILMLAAISFTTLNAQVDAPGQVWQWSVPVKGAINSQGQPRAYMWIPTSCTKVRAMMLAQNNMEEFSIVENQQLRDSLESVGMGAIWVSPTFMQIFNAMEGGRGIVLQMLADLAEESGYAELANVPLIPIGHSATANFPFAFSAAFPERTLCGVSVSGTFPYDYGNMFAPNTECGNTSDYIPHLTTMGEFEGAGDNSSSLNKVFNRRSAHPHTPMSMLPVAGEYHFATSQEKTNFIAYYIKKSAYYRLAQDATATTLATLTPIDPATSGWLVDRWRKNMLPRYPAAPAASYTGKKALIGSAGEENFWCFDEDMARRIETYQGKHFRKTPCLIAYNQSTTPRVVGAQVAQNNNHVQCRLAFIPLNDSLDFELSSSFLTTIPAVSGRCAGWMSTTDPTTGAVTNGVVGATIGYPADNSLSVIDRTIGPIAKLGKDPVTGITKFRMSLERGLGATATNYAQYFVFSVAHPGDAIYKSSVLQADMSVSVYNTTGLAQTITFPQIANVSTILNPITLNATSNLGMPVQYFVREGPAKIENGKVVFTTIPQGAKLPIKVTVVAWQWGRNADLAARMTAPGVPYPGQTIQTAPQIENTFYITGRLTPQVDLTLSATKVNLSVIRVSWSTATELNNKTFEVQRSSDNANWSVLGSVAATNSTLPYSQDDSNPSGGINYYRLKIISADGTYTYSTVVSASVGGTGFVLQGNSEITLKKIGDIIETTGFEVNTSISVSITDCYGRLMYKTNEVVPLTGTVVNKLPKLPIGVYMVNVKSDKENKTLKFVY